MSKLKDAKLNNLKLQNVRGTKDIFGSELEAFNFIVDSAKHISKNYGFKEISTPIFEFSEVFERNLGDESDIISKEVYKFPDRGDNYLTLRPEFTASVIRSFINNGELNQVLPQKLFSYGPVFRYDRPQKGRQRQFHQINFEILGIEDIGGDLESIVLSHSILKILGILPKTTLQINSLGCNDTKGKYEDALKDYFTNYESELSEDSRRRLQKNPLRILDSKDKNDQKISLEAPKINEFYSDAEKSRFDDILQKLKDLEIEFEVNTTLVRGLDYYTSIVFEYVTNDLGAQNTVLAGGRYDNLIFKMGGNNVPAIGFAAGIERLMLISDIKHQDNRPIQIVYISGNEFDFALNLVNKLRCNDIYCEIQYGSNMKKQMKKATQNNAKYVIVIGDEEVKNGILKVKDFDSGDQKEVKVDDLISYLK